MDIRRLLGQAIHALQNGDLSTASRLASQVLTQQPNEANSLQILGNVSAQQGQHEQALAHYEKGLSVNPKHIHLLNFAGLSAKKIDAFKRAEDYFLRAVAVDPNYFHADYNLANLYKADYQFKLAEEHLRKVVRVAPQFIAAQASLADLLEQTHRLQEAQALCHAVLAVDGQHYLARLTLANIALRRKQWREVKDGLSPMLTNKSLSPVNYSVAAGLIAQAEEKMAKFPQALTLFSQANRALQQFYETEYRDIQSIYAPQQVRSMLSYIEAILPRHELDLPNSTSSSVELVREPIFLVGFPRSGTTLLDQILSSHSDICVLEEQENLAYLYQEFDWQETNLDALFALTEERRWQLQQQYWQIIENQKAANNASVIIDKLPLNLVMLAHIHCVFPNARIIFALREPRDSVISCFQQRFQMNRAMYEMLSIEGASHYYDLLMQFATCVLDKFTMKVHKVKYENVIHNLEKESRGLAGFLGVDWQPGMLDYQRTARSRAINTPSAKQVIQPLYTSSQQKYKNYQAQLADYEAFNALRKWSQYWGYPE